MTQIKMFDGDGSGVNHFLEFMQDFIFNIEFHIRDKDIMVSYTVHQIDDYKACLKLYKEETNK